MYSETPDIIPFPTSFKSKVLTQAELEALKCGTLHLLDEVGVHFPSRKALKIFADHGAKVDMDTQTVRIPPYLVQKAMSTAPRSFVLGEREERFDLLLDGNSSYLTTDGTGVHVIDLETREMRASRQEDVAMVAQTGADLAEGQGISLKERAGS
jgi:trimethylamine--corrinoid protein Co-methyltransferase